MKKTEYTSFEDVRLNDPCVYNIMRQGGTVEQCVVALANQKEELFRQLIEAQSISPKKYKLPDGRVMIWRCPDDLVPLTGGE